MLNSELLRFDEESGTWRMRDHRSIHYSDGRDNERLLATAFSEATDLSSDSYELEQWIRDWPSEYHLSRKRSQLLRGLRFNSTSKVLEVGAGCGAITRYLAENFDHVVSVEGNDTRARLARMRTKGLPNLVVSAPFQDVEFTQKFDLIFCVGVLEYSGAFIGGSRDPYDVAIETFASLLSDEGQLVLAIENQLGVKYWSGYPEDHTGHQFDGLEGYLKRPTFARTFGYDELRRRLERRFPVSEFLFPYPDYKTPSCVVAEGLFQRADVGEMLGNISARDYSPSAWRNKGPRRPDSRFVLPELVANGMAHKMANSFLVVASKARHAQASFEGLGVLYSTHRTRGFQTVTKISESPSGSITVRKELQSGHSEHLSHSLRIKTTESQWRNGESLQLASLRILGRKNARLSDLQPVLKQWIDYLDSLSHSSEPGRVEGTALDCGPRNLISGDAGDLVFIDQEWSWDATLRRETVVIRGLFHLLRSCHRPGGSISWSPVLPLRHHIRRLARDLGVETTINDFRDFYRVEETINRVVYNYRSSRVRFWTLCPAPLRVRRAVGLARGFGRWLGRAARRLKEALTLAGPRRPNRS